MSIYVIMLGPDRNITNYREMIILGAESYDFYIKLSHILLSSSSLIILFDEEDADGLQFEKEVTKY